MSDSNLESTGANWEWKRSFEVALYTLLLNAILSYLLNTILSSMSDQLKIQILGSPMGTAIMGTSEVLLAIPLLVYTRKLRITRHQLGMRAGNWTQVLADMAIGGIIGFSMIPISSIASFLNEMVLGPQPNAEHNVAAFTVTSPLELVLLLFSITIVVAPVEEIIMRGFVQQGFEISYGDPIGLVAASLFFSVMHLSLWSIFPLTMLGIMLGLCFRIRHGRILAPVVSHALYMVFLIVSVSY
jgi:membrane protease YdiL (CAAX protease family)